MLMDKMTLKMQNLSSVKAQILMCITKHMLLTKAIIRDKSLLWKIPVALGFVWAGSREKPE